MSDKNLRNVNKKEQLQALGHAEECHQLERKAAKRGQGVLVDTK